MFQQCVTSMFQVVNCEPPLEPPQPLQLVSHDLPNQLGKVMVTLKTTTILRENFGLRDAFFWG